MSSLHIYLRALKEDDARALYDLRVRNREFLRPYEPIQPDDHFTLTAQRQVIEKAETNWSSGAGYGFGVFLTASHDLVGRVSLSNVVRGAWQSCTLGYWLDQSHNGRGYMTQAVRLAVAFAMTEVQLHRVQAGVMPRNVASTRVVEKSGFRYEGLAPYYLNINGAWEDHLIYSITREIWATSSGSDPAESENSR